MRGAGPAGVPAPSAPRLFPPVRYPALPRWKWHIWAPVPARRGTLAKSLLHSGPQFPHLYGGVEGGTRNLEALEQLRSHRTPRRREAIPRGCVGASAHWPQPASRSGTDQSQLTGGQQPEVCAPQPAMGKVGQAGLRKTEGCSLRGVGQHGRLWGSRTACAGPAHPLPAGGATSAGVWLCLRSMQDAELSDHDRGDHLPKPRLGKSKPLLST